MNTRKTIAFAFLAMSLYGCRQADKVSYTDWTLTYDGGVRITRGDTLMAEGLTAEYEIDGKIVNSGMYKKPKFKEDIISDDFGKGKKWTVVYTDDSLPGLEHTFYIYPDYVLTDISIAADKGVLTRYMAPVVMKKAPDVIVGRGKRSLFVPFDNDAWIRYKSLDNPADTLCSYEVTALYDAGNRHGVVIGAIDHDRWKNAVEIIGRSKSLRAYSGVADRLTRDCIRHGAVGGQSVRSARVMMGFFDDWRRGMETFADINALVAPPRRWDKAVPVGWNSWGALAFRVNHDNSTEISDFFADSLQNRSFCNAEGILYTGLDSGWNSFSDDELKDFADRCRRNNQVPCIYWTPFTDWGKNPERDVPCRGKYKYSDIYLYANGKPQELDGAYAVDPTHPAVKMMMEETAEKFRKCGYKFVKMDFMTHGRMEADRWYRSDVTTGTEAYNYGMHLLDSIFSDMYLNLSISPIFPAQYAQSRRIACDAWNKMKDTEYTLNALSYGWWIDRVYSFNDADHVVLRDATHGENRARVTSAVITGMFITGDDFSINGDSLAKSRAMLYLTNADINRIATGRSFRPLNGGDENSEHIFIRHEDNGDAYMAAFNYSDNDIAVDIDFARMGLEASDYSVDELWEHRSVDASVSQTVPAKDVRVFRFRKN